MEDFQINEDKGETEEKINFESIIISQNNIKYILNIEANEDKITFSINDKEQFPSIDYIRTMSLKEIKNLNNIFKVFKSFNDVYEYLKQLSNNKQLNIQKKMVLYQ